jgi:hypothetical protein
VLQDTRVNPPRIIVDILIEKFFIIEVELVTLLYDEITVGLSFLGYICPHKLTNL